MRSDSLFKRAVKVVPGGVHSPVRAFKAVGGTPRYLVAGQGPFVEDADGKRYVDYVGSFGSAILGHAHPDVVQATQEAVAKGLGFSAPHPLGVEVAELLCEVFPGMDQVRFVNSGTEATQTAIRLARGATGRDKIIKFTGCYHGHVDPLLVQAGSGGLTFGKPDSAGIPEAVAKDTLSLPYNDLASVQASFEACKDGIAAVIVEPVAGNMGCILPEPGFLEGLRALCDQYGAALIFDEVMTGFRVAWGGAQLRFGIQPDLTTLGKVIGGGLPVGAIGGSSAWMRHLAPVGGVYQAGTLSGNPITLSAGFATLTALKNDLSVYERLEAYGHRMLDVLKQTAAAAGIECSAHAIGGMVGFFFAKDTPKNLFDVQQSNLAHFPSFFHALLEQGVYWPPSAYEAAFISAEHDDDALAQTQAALKVAFAALAATH